MAEPLNTHNVKMPFGKHKDQPLTRVPVSYLRWMANDMTADKQLDGVPWATWAKTELERRHHQMPQVELSPHAIDNASLRVRKIWHDTRGPEEGLYTWLARMVLEGMKDGERREDPTDSALSIHYKGLKLVIHQGEEFPVLKTIMKSKGHAPDQIAGTSAHSAHTDEAEAA